VHAFGEVKLACVQLNHRLGYLPENIFSGLSQACTEMASGLLDEWIVVDAFQGGAGTSTNLNICEVLANRTLNILGKKAGEYIFCDPIAQVNLHQSTNDVYPTALKIAALHMLKSLEEAINSNQEILQTKEAEFADVLKMGRTELMDAIPITLGRTFGAWADALSRDRWRIFKATERLRVVNLGGTALGTGLGAPKKYILSIVDELRAVTGLPMTRAENLMDGTSNQDVFVEIMGMLKAHAANLMKIAGDLRLLAMGPEGGIAEITLPALQAGSSIMPGKVNPVIPEMLTQIGIQVMACDQAIAWAVSAGQLELNAFLPSIAYNLLSAIGWLTQGNILACEKMLKGIGADRKRCAQWVLKSEAIATVLIPLVGYHQATRVSELMKKENRDFISAACEVTGLAPEKIEALLTPGKLNELGFSEIEPAK